MILPVIREFLDLFVKLFDILIIGRIIMNLMGVDAKANALARFTFDVTEPVLKPLRKLLPQSKSFDLAPLVAVLLLYGLHFLIFGA